MVVDLNIGSQFGEFCEQHEISLNFSDISPPQTNKIVQRKDKKLQEMCRAMLAEQSISQKFWCHALDTEYYIYNRIYSSRILNKAPHEILRGRKPSLEYFRVFGVNVSYLRQLRKLREIR